MRTTNLLLAGCLLILNAGCETADTRITEAEIISALRRENAQLTRQIKQSQTESEQLKKQVEVLSALKPGLRTENLYKLEKIEVTRYTNLYDKDKDGTSEKLIVYIRPIDRQGDMVKATGAVDVQLWDLNKKDAEALLGQWRVEADELKKLWFATLITINYRLTFDVAGILDKYDEPLTVKVAFTDYLTGRVFEEQRVIKPH